MTTSLGPLLPTTHISPEFEALLGKPVNVAIPRALHRQLKVEAVLRGVSLHALVELALSGFLAQQKES